VDHTFEWSLLTFGAVVMLYLVVVLVCVPAIFDFYKDVLVGTSFRVVVIQDCVMDAAAGESMIWNAVWQIVHLYLSGGGCLRQWGSFAWSWRLRHPTSLVSSKRPLWPW
jgi:hypothetical protein